MSELISGLRQANNYVTIEGILEEKGLTKGETSYKDQNGVEQKMNYIGGYLIVGISETEKYKVHYFSKEFTKNGEVSKNYKGLETIMNEYVSRAEALNNNLPENTITQLSISAKFSANDYAKLGNTVAEDKIITSIQLQNNFTKRVTGEFNPHTSFDTEVYFETIEREQKEDNTPSERVKVSAYMPVYNGGVIPITFYTTSDKTYGDIGQYLIDNYEAGKSGAIGGSLACTMTTSTSQASGFGKTVERTFTNYNFEIIIERGNEKQYAVTDAKAFDKAMIKTAVLYRQEQNEKKLVDTRNKNNTVTSAPTNSFSTPSVNTSTMSREVEW